jgi:DNA-binding transcriptional ArsR family regulator
MAGVLAILAFIAATFAVFRPTSLEPAIVFPGLVAGLVYSGVGIAYAPRYLWIGASVFAASLGRLVLLPAVAGLLDGGGRRRRTVRGRPVAAEGVSVAELDELIHQPLRLKIMAALHAERDADPVEFSRLKAVTQATDGNLGSHLTTLEKAGYVARSPRTSSARSPAPAWP